MNARLVLIVSLCLMAFPVLAGAQVQQTPNTLKLEDQTRRPAATLEDVELLVGHWTGPFMGAEAEEVWLPAAGNTMLGMFRLFDESNVFFYEIMVLAEEEGSVSLKLKHFNADLTGWEEKDEMVTFRFVKSTADGLWFEGLTFLKQPDGSLQAYIALGEEDGSIKEESFRYQRVRDR